MARFATANDIINRAALESGLIPISDPLSSTDESFIQLTGLLTSCGQELADMHPWQGLITNYTIDTLSTDTGTYPLPDDFNYMIDQTGWERTNRLPMNGPLSPQQWALLEGLSLGSDPIYATFRLSDNEFDLLPNPPPDGLNINFQYISRNWVQPEGGGARTDAVEVGSDVVLYDPLMTVKMLKMKFKIAKGFDANAAAMEFERAFLSRTGKDTGAPILNASRGNRMIPLLGYPNTPWTNYGI